MAEAYRLFAELGVPPRAVPLKIIHPLLEACSLEEDEDLQSILANLLAGAANPNDENTYHGV